MPNVRIHVFSVWEDTGLTVMARVLGNAGTAITQASLTSIKMDVFDIDDESAPVAIGTQDTLTISDVVFDSLQTNDPRWSDAGGSATGYNFLHTIAESRFASPGKVRVEFLFEPTSGKKFLIVTEGTVKPRYAG